MKKALVVLMALAVMVLVPLTGCGGGGGEAGSTPEDEVRAAAERYAGRGLRSDESLFRSGTL